MNSKVILGGVAMIFAVSAAQASAKDDLQTLNSAKLSLKDAIQMAEKQGNGKGDRR